MIDILHLVGMFVYLFAETPDKGCLFIEFLHVELCGELDLRGDMLVHLLGNAGELFF